MVKDLMVLHELPQTLTESRYQGAVAVGGYGQFGVSSATRAGWDSGWV